VIDLKNIAVVGNYVPRRCGIATFTTDLVNAIAAAGDPVDCWAVAMNDRPEGYRYPAKVRFEINRNSTQEYRLAGDFLNISQADIVCLQHEYGIFGGQAGSYILQLLRELRAPVVTTLHTVLEEPTPEQKKVLNEVVELSDRVIVMAHKARSLLREIYAVAERKISFVHHGIPDMPFVDPHFYKDHFAVEGKKVLLTFGLLSPNKGIEYMIRALPRIVERHPDVVYIVLGATHPHIKKVQGEKYRLGLESLARKLGVDRHLRFHNRFVELRELCEFLGAADVYVTPYLNEEQIVSGTLAYAMGVGKATVSTPYWYASEMMAEGRGLVVPFRDSDALAEAVGGLLDSELERNTIRKRAYSYMRNAIWSRVANEYLSAFYEVKGSRSLAPRLHSRGGALERDKDSLPDLNLDHLRRLTDETGILQHATFSVPDYSHGYCIDDNARALIVAVTARRLFPAEDTLQRLQTRYLAFLKHSFNEGNGYFRNFMGYDRTWLEEMGSEDSHGRALWGLGVACAFSTDPGCVAVSTTLFHRALKVVERFTHARSLAFSLVGIHAYLSRFLGDSEVRRVRAVLAERLIQIFNGSCSDEWPWFEDRVTYANAKLPQALLLSGQWMQREDMVRSGFRILDWLLSVQTDSGHFSPIGNAGWLTREQGKARFDQQAIEAQAMVETTILAYYMTRDEKYAAASHMAFNWFLGRNDLNVALYDYSTGGCCDGLQPDGPNYNQGAESTLAWLLSLIAIQAFQTDQKDLHYVG